MAEDTPSLAVVKSRTGASKTLTGGRVRDIEVDAPSAPHHEDDSVQLLAAELRGHERANLVQALELLAAELPESSSKRKRKSASESSSPPPPISPGLIKSLAMLFAAFFAVVQPVATQLAERVLSPRTELADRLDQVLVSQASLHATVLAIAKWTVDVEKARAAGLALPPPPAAVTLILAQDELARDTGISP